MPDVAQFYAYTHILTEILLFSYNHMIYIYKRSVFWSQDLHLKSSEINPRLLDSNPLLLITQGIY